MSLRRCPDCDGAGQTPHTDVRMCAARPEFGAAGTAWVECPTCAGHGWLDDAIVTTGGNPDGDSRGG